MKSSIRVIFFLFISVSLFGQFPGDCEYPRYVDGISFILALENKTVTYGKNVNALGDTMDLKMTFYYEKDDNKIKKPVVIMAFGGAFVYGKRDDMVPFCAEIATKGFITATIDYRLWPIAELGQPDAEELALTALGAVSDMKAAIRKVRQMADGNNELSIDPERIIVGGLSAGAVTALHTGCIDENDELSQVVRKAFMETGGLSGNSGLPETDGYSNEVSGVLNMSGALLDTMLLDEGEPPIVSIHGIEDGTVPFECGLSLNILYVCGSGAIHKRAQSVGVYSELLGVEKGDHTDIYIEAEFEDERNKFLEIRGRFMQKVLCGVTELGEYETSVVDVDVFPNPMSEGNSTLFLTSPLDITQYTITDINGRVVESRNYNIPKLTESIQVENIKPGIYILKGTCRNNNSGEPMQFVEKFVRL